MTTLLSDYLSFFLLILNSVKGNNLFYWLMGLHACLFSIYIFKRLLSV